MLSELSDLPKHKRKDYFDMDEFMSILTESGNTDEIKKQHIKEHLKEVVPQDVYEKWITHFVIEEIDDKQIIIGYYGKASLNKFDKKYKKRVWLEICSYIGCVKQLNIYKRKQPPVVDYDKVTKPDKVDEKNKNNSQISILKNPLHIIKVFIVIAIVAGIVSVTALLGCNYLGNRTFSENFYNVGNIKANEKIRIIQISDLHTSTYGEENIELIQRVKKLKPDIIIYTGDCIDSDSSSVQNSMKVFSDLSEVAPSYYVYGNNEVDIAYGYVLTQSVLDEKFGFNDDKREPEKLLEIKDSLEEELEKTGVNVLKNETACITVGSTSVDIYGSLTSNPSSFWSYGGESFSDFIYTDTSHLKVLAIHEPFIFEEFESDFWGDLMLCGHTHGGMARVPILGPLYTHEGGLFPERNNCYVCGRYRVAGKTLIVSPGLENENIFRINNKPELTIIDVNRF